MKILSLSTCPLDPLLGSGKTRLRWSTGLRELGHTVDMFEPKDFEAWHGLRRALRFRQALGVCDFVKDKLRTQEYDLVEFFGGEFGLITWQLAKRSERPLIVAHTDGLELLASERERAYNPPLTLRKRLYDWFSRQTHERLSQAAFDYADVFVTGCELDRQYVLDHEIYSPEQTEVIAPGLDDEYLCRSFTAEKDHRVAYTGSWIARKGTEKFVGVMTLLLKRDEQLRLDIFGTGGDRDRVLAQFPIALHNRIVVHGRLTNTELAQKLAKAKVFFFPTQYEGFGMAIAEAMACSCAAVTTPTGFGAELRDGEEALIYDFNDAEAMESALESLLGNDEQRAKIARSGWERVQRLSWSANVKKLESTYTRWILEYKKSNAVSLS
jgi:glycosyltransferase involved in cell wall biosynthesis